MNIKPKEVILNLCFAILGIILLYPLVITFTNSFMSETEIVKHYTLQGNRMFLIPDQITLKSYIQILFLKPKYLILFWNSVKIATCVVVGQVIISFFAAYGFVRSNFKGKQVVFFLYIIVMLLPVQVALVPNFVIVQKLGLIDTHLAIILPGIFSPFGVFLLKQYMEQVPVEYAEAAQIDGCGEYYILFNIFVPILKPGIFALTILTFIEYWNVVEQAIVCLRDMYKEPLSVFLARVSENQIGNIFAASCLYMLPVLLLFLYGQDYLVEGIELSGVKG